MTMADQNTLTKHPYGLIVLIVAITGLIAPSAAVAGGTWPVLQCFTANGQAEAPDLVDVRNPNTAGNNYELQNSCSSRSGATFYPTGLQRNDYSRDAAWLAPTGTHINGVLVSGSASVTGGHTAMFFTRRASGQADIFGYPSGGTLQGFSSGTVNATEFRARFRCANSFDCEPSFSNFNVRNVVIGLVDDVAPSAPSLGNSLVSGGWKRGTQPLGITATDTGGGINRIRYEVNGVAASEVDVCAEASGGQSGTAGRMKPCGSSGTYEFGVNTAAGPWQEGNNTLKGCGIEYGTGAAETCRTQTISVDNTAPTAPINLEVVQGSSWQQTNDFDLSWTNPGQAHAPIDRATITVTGPSGTAVYHRAGNVASAQDIQAPAVGEFTVKVHLRDAAGNENPAAVATQTIRFDNVPPEEAVPEKANGWINREEVGVGYGQSWRKPRVVPVSGIKGYATVVDQSPSTDPCDLAGSGGTGAQCSDAEVNFKGIDNISTTLSGAQLLDGENYVHVASVSGSGKKTDEIRHTRLLVDTRDPAVSLRGAPAGWVRDAVEVSAVASDAHSGMVDTDDYPDDEPPATFLTIDGKEISEADADVNGVVEGDGIHEIAFRARDLAGNVGPEQGAEVRIDGTNPVAFLEQPDRTDPELIEARVEDATSGIATAELQFREDGKDWEAIPSSLSGSRVSGRMDSTKMKEGQTYTFRVLANDQAGNQVETSKLQNGDERKVVGPLRNGTSISELKINGKRKAAKVRYGKQGQLTGKLIDENGEGVGGAMVAVVESYDSGAKRSQKVGEARTNGDGVFSTPLERGPSRSIMALYGGNKLLLDSKSESAPRLNVRGKVKLAATNKRVKPGKTTIFKGRIAKGGAKIPGGGKLVEVQVRVGNKWKVLDRSLRTNKKGKFRIRYRFARFYTQRTRFQFRAVVLKETAWPYLPAKSRRQRITIVP